jgi:hypothetical protein
VQLAKAARGTQGPASAPVASPAMTLGLDRGHTPRALARVCQRQGQPAAWQRDTARPAEAKGARDKRQGRDPRGVSGVAGRAGRKAERRGTQAGNPQAAGQQMPAALAWWAAPRRLSGRQTAPAPLEEAHQPLPGACGRKGTRRLREERTRRHGERLRAPRPAAVSAPV